jgi:hypothetical protein
MKKTLLAAVVLAASLFAKNTQAQIRLGVQAGFAVNNPSVKSLGDVKGIQTITPGIVAEFNITPGIMFRPSINYSQSGFTEEISQNIPAAGNIPAYQLLSTTDQKINDLLIPLDLAIPIKAGKGKFLITAGPTLTIGLSGTVNTEVRNQTSGTLVTNTSQKIQFGNQTAELKRIDWGSRFGIGYTFKFGLNIMANYKLGLTNLSNAANGEIKYNQLGITAAYFLLK